MLNYINLKYTSPWSRFELTTSVVIGTDCIGSCKSNYHTITATTAPAFSYDDIVQIQKDLSTETIPIHKNTNFVQDHPLYIKSKTTK